MLTVPDNIQLFLTDEYKKICKECTEKHFLTLCCVIIIKYSFYLLILSCIISKRNLNNKFLLFVSHHIMASSCHVLYDMSFEKVLGCISSRITANCLKLMIFEKKLIQCYSSWTVVIKLFSGLILPALPQI
jgi:hypothetical protein